MFGTEIIIDINEERIPFNTEMVIPDNLYQVFKKIYDIECMLGEVQTMEENMVFLKINLDKEKIDILHTEIKTLISQSTINFNPINLN